jgi:hypothetical protein
MKSQKTIELITVAVQQQTILLFIIKKLVVVRPKRIFNNYEISKDYRINYGGSAAADYTSVQQTGMRADIYVHIYTYPICTVYLNQRKLKKDTGQVDVESDVL